MSSEGSSTTSEAHATPDYYMQVAVYAAGHALALAVGAGLYAAWAIIMPFQEPLLWALLCSIALRDIKSWLVQVLRRELIARSIPSCFFRLLVLPLLLLIDAFKDVHAYIQRQVSTLNHLACTLPHNEGDQDRREPPRQRHDNLEHKKQLEQEEQAVQEELMQMSSKSSRGSECGGSAAAPGPTSHPLGDQRDLAKEASDQAPPAPASSSKHGRRTQLLESGARNVQKTMYCVYRYGYALLFMACMSFRPIREFFDFKELKPLPPSRSSSLNRMSSSRRTHKRLSSQGRAGSTDGGPVPAYAFGEFRRHTSGSGNLQDGSHAPKHGHKAEPFPWQAHGNQEEDDNNESPSTPLFRWLLRAALARQAWAWGVAWGPMSVTTVGVVLVLLIALANRLSSAASAVAAWVTSLEPKSSIKSGIQRTISRRRPATVAPAPPERASSGSSWMSSAFKGDAGLESSRDLAGSKSGAGNKLQSLLKGVLQVLRWLGTATILTARRALLKITSYVKHMDAYMRHKLMDNLDALVSVALVVGLILGTLLLTAVLCVQIGIEGRRAVVAADRSVRRHSTTMATVAAAAVSSDDLELLNTTDPTDPMAQVLGTGHPAMDGVITNVRQHKQGLMDTAVALQQHALKAVQIFLPTLQKHADSMASKFVERYNLTTVLRDMEKVYFSLPISINCTKEQLGSFAEEVASTALRLQPLEEAVEKLGRDVAANKTELKQVMEAWERKWMAMQAPILEPPSSTDSNAGGGEASGMCKGSEAVSPPGMGVSAGGEEGGVLNDTGTGTCAGTPLESGGDTEGNESCRSEDGSGSLHNEVVGRSVQGGSQEEGDKRGACGLEGGAEANQQQQQQQQQQGQEQGAGTEGTSEDGGASQLEFSDEEWEQGIAHARLLEVRRALAAARAAAKEALASASVAQGDYKLAVRKLRGCHGLNSASDRNMGPAGSVGGDSGEFLDKLLGGGKGGAAQLGSLATRITRTWERLSQAELSLVQEELSGLKQEFMAMLDSRTGGNLRSSFSKGQDAAGANRTALWADHPYLQYLPLSARKFIQWLPDFAKRLATRATSVLATEDPSAASTNPSATTSSDGTQANGNAPTPGDSRGTSGGGVDGGGVGSCEAQGGERHACKSGEAAVGAAAATDGSSGEGGPAAHDGGSGATTTSWFYSLQLWGQQGQRGGPGGSQGLGGWEGLGDEGEGGDNETERMLRGVGEGQRGGGGEGHNNLFGALSGLAMSVGSATGGLAASLFGGTTSLALDTTTGLIRMGMFLFDFALDLLLFVATTIALLASTTDPLQRLLHMLPIGARNQEMASRALSNAMRGVFASSLKLAAFHAAFTWLTLKACGTHLTHLLTVVSMLVSVLPLLPCWVAVLPPAFELAMSSSGGGWVWAVGLIAAHVAAQSYADDIIMGEIDSSISYLTGLAVAGGMALWPSAPLKGVLLGPMMLAMLSVFSQLHSQLVNETEVSQAKPDEDMNHALRGYRREYGSSRRHPAAFSVPPRHSRELHRAGSFLFGMPPLPDDPPTSGSDEDCQLKPDSQ